MFSEYEPENTVPWVGVNGRSTSLPRTVYPSPTKPAAAPAPRRVGPAPAPPVVRELTGPRTRQEVGYGPHHSTASDARRFDFSRPQPPGLGVSLINVSTSAAAQAEAEAQDHAIRLFHGSYGSNVARAGTNSRAQNVHCEANDPLSALTHVKLERFEGSGAEGAPNANYQDDGIIQPRISASYIAKQTAQMMAAKAEQLQRYQRDVQDRLNRRVEEQRRKEKERRATLPPKVQSLVYSIKPSTIQAPEAQQQHQHVRFSSEVDVEASPLPSPASLEEFLAQGSPSKHVRVREQEESVRPSTAGASRGGASTSVIVTSQRAQLSKAESLAFMLEHRKQESAASRAKVQTVRAGGGLGSESARGRTGGVAFGHGLFPRDARTPSPPKRKPNFDKLKHRAEEEPVEEERVLVVPQPTMRQKPKMSDAVAGRVTTKKERPSSSQPRELGTFAQAEKHSAYRRLVLERLHALSATLGHPLPPLCACGFTPKEEYELLFAYGGTIQTASVAPPAQQSQPPFNLSTIISRSSDRAAEGGSIHLQRASSSTAGGGALPSHVTVDSSRHAFLHKHNCQYHAQPETYVKAMANLLHTLEDQQQI